MKNIPAVLCCAGMHEGGVRERHVRQESKGRRESMRNTKQVFSLTIAALMVGACLVGTVDAFDKSAMVSVSKAIRSGGNGIYTVSVEDSDAFNCGAWTAVTGSLHPAGPGLNVLYGSGSPGTSYTTLRSYTSGVDYTSSSECTPFCSVATPTVENILSGATVVGFRMTWSFTDGTGGPSVDFIQEVVVDGPADGTETVDNTAIRETHTVRNNGPGALDFGLRKMWDWEIADDDGPYFGDCANPTAACDRSMNLTAGEYPAVFIINEDPAITACPPGITPAGPNCGGAPVYVVAGTVAPPSSLSPPPDAPELLQFNSWGELTGDCWQPALFDNATCGGGDTAQAYFYGLTSGTAISLAAGSSDSFTQWIVAAEDECPDIVEPEPGPEAIPTQGRYGTAVLVVLLIAAAVWILHRRITG
jgi:hypothetical protein